MTTDADGSPSEPRRYRAISSGQVIGELVRALERRDPEFTSRQGRRYLAGGHVSEKQRRRILEVLAKVLIEYRIVPADAIGKRTAIDPTQGLADLISGLAERWDRFGAYAYANSGRVYRVEDGVMAYLRLAVVDLAVRGIALLWLTNAPVPEEDTPRWARRGGVGKSLRKAVNGRVRFAESVGVSRQTVDAWLDRSARPSPDHIHLIAEVIAENSSRPVEVESLAEGLTRDYWLAAIADRLAEAVGRGNVEMLAQALCGLIARVLSDLREIDPPDPVDAIRIQTETLLLGCAAPRAKHLLDLMWKQEGNRTWRVDIQAASINWVQRIQQQVAALGTPESFGPIQHRTKLAAIAKRTIARIAEDSFERQLKGDSHVAAEARYECIRVVQAALELEAENAWLHLQLGSMLVDLGDIDDGVREFWLAEQLAPGWDLPLGEIGITYYNAGKLDRAREHFEMQLRRPSPRPELRMRLGLTLMRLGRTEEALPHLEAALKSEPNNPITLNAASRCSSLLGDKLNARRYEKKARLLGSWNLPALEAQGISVGVKQALQRSNHNRRSTEA